MTLLEVVIALSLMALMAGIGAISYVSGEDERALRKAASQLEAMASRGHAMAVLHQKPFWLRIEEDRVLLVGAEIGKAPTAEDGEFGLPDPGEDREEAREVIYDEYPLKVTLSLQRWGDGRGAWLRPEKKEFLTWQFQSTGLCEPLSLKIELGSNWIIMHMHPLTARVDDEEMYIE